MSRGRRPLLLLASGGLLLTAATLGGLARIGWAGVPAPASSTAFHGVLMVSGFFATLVSLERAVAVRGPIAFSSPVLHALGGLLLLAGLPSVAGPLLLAGAAAFLATMVRITVQLPTGFHLVMTLGTASLVVADALWLAGAPAPALFPWWALFLVLTIVGERLELGRMLRIPNVMRQLLVVVACLAPLAAIPAGARLLGLCFVFFAAWLARWDLARRTIHATGLARFAAACLLAGYAWLGVAGTLLAVDGALRPGLHYDAVVHALFLGFVVSMVFAHAPIILPAVLGFPLPYARAAWLPAVLLHVGVALRVGADLAGSWSVRRWAGLANAAALVLFALVSVTLSVRASRACAAGRTSGHPAPA